MSNEKCVTCGHEEAEHYTFSIAKPHRDRICLMNDCSCQKFIPQKKLIELSHEEFEEALDNYKPQNHSPIDSVDKGSTFKDKEPEGNSKLPDSGSDKETLAEKKCYDAEGKFWYYKTKDVKEFIKDILGMIENEELIDWDDFVEYIKERAGKELIK